MWHIDAAHQLPGGVAHVPATRVTSRRIRISSDSVALRTCAALALAAGPLLLSTAAHAAEPLGGVPRSLPATVAADAACQISGVTASDRKVADTLRPSMNGRRLGRAVTGQSIACARAIVDAVRSRGLPARAAVIAVTTAIAESTLHNHTVARDHDSLGLFQQRPSMGWGRPEQLVNVGYATDAFLDAMLRKFPGDRWMTGDIGQICQEVQRSAYPGAYAPEAHDAQLIVARLWESARQPGARATTPGTTTPGTTTPGTTTPGTTVPAAPATPEASPSTPAGPFQQQVVSAFTGLDPTDERHQLSTADWNGDRRADLVVVQGSDTDTGRTNVHIMDGVSGFQALLQSTTTAFGPADGRHTFSLADWNADGRPDLVGVQRSGTASGRMELRIADGASNFQRVDVQTVTALPASDARYGFTLTDWNADGRPDLVTVRYSPTKDARTEVRVLDGAANFQRDLLPAPITLAPTDDRHEAQIADWNSDRRPDLVMVQKSGTASGQTEVEVLDGAAGLGRSLARTSTAHGPLDDRHAVSVADWSGDGRLDLVVLQKSGTVSGRTDMLVLGG